jgi:hypothetical protein
LAFEWISKRYPDSRSLPLIRKADVASVTQKSLRAPGSTSGFVLNIYVLSALIHENIVRRAHYSIIANPKMRGMIIGCWATPVMTAPRLLFAVLNTLHIVSHSYTFSNQMLVLAGKRPP